MKVTLNTKFYYMPHLDKSIYEFNVTPGYSISSIKYEWLDEVFEFEFILSKNFHKTANYFARLIQCSEDFKENKSHDLLSSLVALHEELKSQEFPYCKKQEEIATLDFSLEIEGTAEYNGYKRFYTYDLCINRHNYKYKNNKRDLLINKNLNFERLIHLFKKLIRSTECKELRELVSIKNVSGDYIQQMIDWDSDSNPQLDQE